MNISPRFDAGNRHAFNPMFSPNRNLPSQKEAARDVAVNSDRQSGGTSGTTAAGWTPSQAEQIQDALQRERELLGNKKNELDRWDDRARTNFNRSFGTTSKPNRDIIEDRIDDMLDLNSNMTLDNFKPVDPKKSKPGLFAYVYPDDPKHTIYLGPAFWKSPSTGTDSQAGTLAHEMSHFNDIGDTDDGFPEPVYGLKASRDLAAKDPSKAIRHADSFQYYLEDARLPGESKSGSQV